MTGQDFLNLKIGDYIHDIDNGDEWIVESNDGLYVNCRCTIAGLKGHWIDKEYPWMASIAHYFTKGKLKQSSPWISCKDSLPNEGEQVFVNDLHRGYLVAYLEKYEDRMYFIEKQECIELEVEFWMRIPQ